MLQLTTLLIITRGADGSTIMTRERRVNCPAVLTVRPVDPTGVSDAYRAGLIRGLALGLPWETIGRMAAHPRPGGRPCGACDACRIRAKGFAEAGARDPAASG